MWLFCRQEIADVPTSSERQRERQNGDILTIQEAAKMLGMSRQTLMRRTRDKTVPGVKLGKKWLYRASTLAALVP